MADPKEWWFDKAREAWRERNGHHRHTFAIGAQRDLRVDGDDERQGWRRFHGPDALRNAAHDGPTW
jgi:hypothetical protein